MPVYIAALIETLIYLTAVPVCAAFSLSTRGKPHAGVGVSAFSLRSALRRARRSHRPARSTRPKDRGRAKQAWRAIVRLRGAEIRLQGGLGLGDAAATATACGALRALVAALGAHAGRVEVDVAPLFGEAGLCLDLQGMIRVPAGQIMSAVAANNIQEISRRIAKWTDTRLKA